MSSSLNVISANVRLSPGRISVEACRTLTGCADCWGCWFPVGITGIFPSRNRLGRNGGILDTFDALVPTYDYPQTDQAVMEWFESAGLVDARVRLGENGVLGNGKAPFRNM